jgi:hypothetical protein
MWDLLKRIKDLKNLPWLMLGDFNEAMWQSEHFSNKKRGEKQMYDFRQVLSYCDLHDLGFSGAPWTFDNKQSGQRNVKVRLDRVVACLVWSNLYPHYHVSHLTSSRSDHCPILLKLEQKPAVSISGRPRRYEACWEREAALVDEVKTAWEGHNKPKDLGDVASNLSGVMDCLQSWSKRTIGSVSNRIGKLRKKLRKINMRNSVHEHQRKKSIEMELDSLLEQEEIYWIQRGRANWLMQGDRNTSYFHNAATAQKKRNLIRRLLDDTGVWKEGTDLNSHVVNYFTNLFTSEDTGNNSGVLAAVHSRISSAMNDVLMAPYTAEEVKKALFSIGDLKSPGPDGLHAIFFKKILAPYW